MPISDQVKQVVETTSAERATKPEYARLRDFYTKAQQAGIVQKQAYTIPPLDTAGHRLYQLTSSKTNTEY